MTAYNHQHIIEQFISETGEVTIVPFGKGHINDTYLVKSGGSQIAYILQRKNHQVFKNIEAMMDNIQKVTSHIRQKLIAEGYIDYERRVMQYLKTRTNDNFYLDGDGNYWTMCLYIQNSHTIESVRDNDQAYSAGQAFGQFQQYLDDLPGESLVETITDFHNGYFRLKQLNEAVQIGIKSRISEMTDVIDFLQSKSDQMLIIQKNLESGVIPMRITHNDTKINNVLYDTQGKILCIIDLDTVMPGSVLFDFGDAIRTLCNTAAEDESDLIKIKFQKAFFESFTDGYLSLAQSFLTKEELGLLALSTLYMTWEQALRFMTDYLTGDSYYKVKYPEHNKIRTMGQVTFLKELFVHQNFLDSCIHQYTKK
ncbi:MAG TPA: aminoglycoside phosphotransferase family protein [Saprospiraceae bacterium]|nr:aminoglycoside phosphotransferase family protein [Saprospiraceae bacterium]